MSEQQILNKRTIAKNTVMLYTRMILFVVVSLYTSRVVLQTLGVEDYGVYGVVGGVVSMFSFLNAAMSGATSRFLTYELGRGDFMRLKETFSSAMIIHLLIAITIAIIAETLGLWFLCNKLVIPEERMFAAHVVYQLSVISMFFTVTQVPYNSIIIAHEKLDVYAYVELLNVCLKLFIVYLLIIGHMDKLILYAVLTLVVSIVIALIYRIYCLRHFEESSFHFVWDKSLLVPMISFSGWDLYGNMSVVFFSQGIAMLLNMFFGPVLNAANNISITVQGTIKGFAYNVIQAFRPQIIKQYAMGNVYAVVNYCIMASQYTLILFSLIAIPIFYCTTFVLRLWLGIIPDYADIFLKIVIVGTVFNLGNNIIFIPLHAVGRMKLLSFVTGTGFILAIPVMYLCLSMGVSPDKSYWVHPCAYLICFVSSLFILKRNMPLFHITKLVLHGYIKPAAVIFSSLIVCEVWNLFFPDSWFGLLGICIINVIILLVGLLYVIMNSDERKTVFTYLKNKL